MQSVCLTCLRLGLTSFGGPIAHIRYFRAEFIERRACIGVSRTSWLCSVLHGPTSVTGSFD